MQSGGAAPSQNTPRRRRHREFTKKCATRPHHAALPAEKSRGRRGNCATHRKASDGVQTDEILQASCSATDSPTTATPGRLRLQQLVLPVHPPWRLQEPHSCCTHPGLPPRPLQHLPLHDAVIVPSKAELPSIVQFRIKALAVERNPLAQRFLPNTRWATGLRGHHDSSGIAAAKPRREAAREAALT